MRGDDGEIQRLNWKSIMKRLRLEAEYCCRRMPEVFNGMSAEDIVQNLFVEFLDSSWDPAKSPVVQEKGLEEGVKSFLSMMLERRIIDQIRSRGRHTFVQLDSQDATEYRRESILVGDVIRQMSNRSRSVESDIQFAQMQESLIKIAGDDEIAVGIIEAAPELTGSGKVDQELAEMVLNDRRATDKIVNARKRLLRKLPAEKGRSETWKPMNKATSASAASTMRERLMNEGFVG